MRKQYTISYVFADEPNIGHTEYVNADSETQAVAEFNKKLLGRSSAKGRQWIIKGIR